MSMLDDWQRPRPTDRQRRTDLVVGLVVVAGALLNVILARSVGVFVFGVRRGGGEMLVWAAAVTVPLIWRRVHPEAVVLVTAVVFIAGQVRGGQESQFASGAIFAAIYAVGAWGRDRDRARWLRIAVIGAMFVWLAVSWLVAADTVAPRGLPGATGELPPLLAGVVNTVVINVLIFGFAYLFGETTWLAARREHQLRLQAEELRAARAAAEERAVFGERVRIARELHDVVAHHVSVMGIQAAAARRALDKDLGKARGALSAVEQGARTAVDELHRMLGALRAPAPALAPAPQVRAEASATAAVAADTNTTAVAGAAIANDAAHAAGVERLGDLAERVRAAGLLAKSAVFGEPVPLPASVSQALYRIAQEAVTNTLKHASAATIDIRLRYLAREVELDVTDDGVGGPPNRIRPSGPGRAGSVPTAPGPGDQEHGDGGTSGRGLRDSGQGGLGLIGMRERVVVHGGTIEVGPRAAGGFRVRARLPLPETQQVTGTAPAPWRSGSER